MRLKQIDIDKIQRICDSCRCRLIKMHCDLRLGHLGGNLSCLDAMLVLHHAVIGPDDRFVLSKGHSAGAYYITLWSMGLIAEEELATFCQDNTRLPAHPPASGLPGVLFATGSLGHGPSLACGMALAAKFAHADRRIWCLTSDGEWQEGSCWEALIVARHRRLNNLIILIDVNGLQGFGSTSEVASFSDLPERLAGFGVDVQIVSGHDVTELVEALQAPIGNGPKVLCLKTTKGKGIASVEGTLACHYLPPTDEQYCNAAETLMVRRA